MTSYIATIIFGTQYNHTAIYPDGTPLYNVFLVNSGTDIDVETELRKLEEKCVHNFSRYVLTRCVSGWKYHKKCHREEKVIREEAVKLELYNVSNDQMDKVKEIKKWIENTFKQKEVSLSLQENYIL